VRALELAEIGSSLIPASDQLWSTHMRHPSLVVGLELPPEEIDRRIVERTDEMLRRGVIGEVTAALDGAVSRTARQALGLDELATLPPAEARARIIDRTRRYATYQRKWMRRIPGIVMIDACRPTEDVADEIVDLARRR